MMNESLSIAERLQSYQFTSIDNPPPVVIGRLTRVVGLTMEAIGIEIPIGSECEVVANNGQLIDAEVVGFNGDKIFLMPINPMVAVSPGAQVIPKLNGSSVIINDHLLGRVINGMGQPLDTLGNIAGHSANTDFQLINPLHRAPIHEPLDVGIRVINGLITIGKGQRLGLFAGSGVGKSVLLGMMTRFTSADIVVVGLIGERGREVQEFVEHSLGPEGLKKSVVVASPADDSPLMRLRASELASKIAEYYRDQGKNVLLLMDSLTRYAQAQREIALAIGEPPATRGYPPSVFAKLPQLVERAGNGRVGEGSITAFYTVLTEGDDLQDPVADSARAILDGHIVLSRKMAEQGIYPAIDVEASISRAMNNIVDDTHLKQLQLFKQLLAKYHSNKDLVNIGAYVKGADKEMDIAIEIYPQLKKFIQQGLKDAVTFEESQLHLKELISPFIDES